MHYHYLPLLLLISTPYQSNGISVPKVSDNSHAINLDVVGQVSNALKLCKSSSECPGDQACIKSNCKDPCEGSCAPDAKCRVIQHRPICSCALGSVGDPSKNCGEKYIEVTPRVVPKIEVTTERHIPKSIIQAVVPTASPVASNEEVNRAPSLFRIEMKNENGANRKTAESESESVSDAECGNRNHCAGDPCGPVATCTPFKLSPTSCPIGRSCKCNDGYEGAPPNCTVSKSGN